MEIIIKVNILNFRIDRRIDVFYTSSDEIF